MSIRKLSFGLKSTGGRNNYGRITSFHRGGGHKQNYEFINNKYDLLDSYGLVVAIKYCATRTAKIGLICFMTGHYGYMPLNDGVKEGSVISISCERREKSVVGDVFSLKYYNSGEYVSNLEIYPGSGSVLARAAGSYCKVVKVYKSLNLVLVKLNSGKFNLLNGDCLGSWGQVSNIKNKYKRLKKAGVVRWLGRRPVVRGVAMNPVDHPHGGGEGKTSGGRPSVTPWGRLTLGVKTRSKKKGKIMLERKFSKSSWKNSNMGLRKKENLKHIWNTSYKILVSDIGKVYYIYNGSKFEELFVEENMVGYRWGEFVLTRQGSHDLTKKKKTVNKKKK